MRVSFIVAGASLLYVAAPANSQPNVDGCGAWLSAQWRDAVSTHQIDPAKHLPVVGLFLPRTDAARRSQEAVRELTQAFPSYKEDPSDAIVMGCCSMPIFGSISLDELAKLVATNFITVCNIGYRTQASSIQVRMEYREPYERGVGTDPYFWISSVQIVKN